MQNVNNGGNTFCDGGRGSGKEMLSIFLLNIYVNLKLTKNKSLLVVVFNLASDKPFGNSPLTFGPRITSSTSHLSLSRKKCL